MGKTNSAAFKTKHSQNLCTNSLYYGGKLHQTVEIRVFLGIPPSPVTEPGEETPPRQGQHTTPPSTLGHTSDIRNARWMS